MPLRTLMFLYCCSAKGAAAGPEDCAGAGGACARAPTIAAAIENVATRRVAKVLFPACSIGTNTPLKFGDRSVPEGGSEIAVRAEPWAITGDDRGHRDRLSFPPKCAEPRARLGRAAKRWNACPERVSAMWRRYPGTHITG